MMYQMQQTNPRRRGLTLMELVVVLTVLAAVAAIALPLFPNLLRRAHKSTDATQTSETAKAVQLYQALYLSYPNQFDSLTDSDGNFPPYLPNDAGAATDNGNPGNPFGGFVTEGNLTADEVAALERVGITQLHELAADNTGADFAPTTNPYADTASPPTATTIDTTTPVAILDTNVVKLHNHTLENVINADPGARFVLFGVGPRCTMVGKVLQDAPTSVPQNSTLTPALQYARVGLVFKVSGTEVDRTERARFVAAVAMEDDELESTEKDLVGYYEVAADDAGATAP